MKVKKTVLNGAQRKFFNTISLPIYGSRMRINRKKSWDMRNITRFSHQLVRSFFRFFKLLYKSLLLLRIAFNHFRGITVYSSLTRRGSSMLRSLSSLKLSLGKVYCNTFQTERVIENDIGAKSSIFSYVRGHLKSVWFQ